MNASAARVGAGAAAAALALKAPSMLIRPIVAVTIASRAWRNGARILLSLRGRGAALGRERIGTRLGDLVVLLRARTAAHTDGSDVYGAHHQRHAALQRCECGEVWQRRH